MKSVGKQLEEARLAKSWTPELAARETKIKVDRIRDLETDDYTHFSSPTYARGFVRTYARALGLDEYRLLRQLDNKLPEDDNATFIPENGGLPYVPEPTQVIHASSAPRTGLYIFLGLGFTVLAVMAFVVLEAYRAGELPRYFANNSPDGGNAPTNLAPVVESEAPPHAVPVDPNDITHAARALPVDLSQLNAGDTNAGPVSPAAVAANPAPADSSDDIPGARRALPVDLSTLNNAPGATAPAVTVAPAITAAPVASVAAAAPAPAANPPAAAVSSTPTPAAEPAAGVVPLTTATPPRALPVDPRELVADAATTPSVPPQDAGTPPPPAPTMVNGNLVTPVDLTGDRPVQESMAEAQAKKRLVLTASRDSFIRVTALDAPQGQAVLYASVLRAGQSLAFGGHKFSVDVSVPSAVDIALDGVNYGPHSEGSSPETFTIESHQP